MFLITFPVLKFSLIEFLNVYLCILKNIYPFVRVWGGGPLGPTKPCPPNVLQSCKILRRPLSALLRPKSCKLHCIVLLWASITNLPPLILSCKHNSTINLYIFYTSKYFTNQHKVILAILLHGYIFFKRYQYLPLLKIVRYKYSALNTKGPLFG